MCACACAGEQEDEVPDSLLGERISKGDRVILLDESYATVGNKVKNKVRPRVRTKAQPPSLFSTLVLRQFDLPSHRHALYLQCRLVRLVR